MLLSTHTPELFRAAVAQVCARLRRGEVVALPTETVYGLAANALDPDAVRRIYEIKGRPAHNPLIVHVAGGAMARKCSRAWPAEADALARAFWPGPLTVVVPKSANIPDLVSAGGDTVGLRWPSHPFMQAVIRACDFPLAAPSANLSNAISPTAAAHVMEGLRGRVACVVDGGPCAVGIESTVVDLVSVPVRVLRPGMIHAESLAAVLSGPVVGASESAASAGGVLRSPGQLAKHYAPAARLVVLGWGSESDLASRMAQAGLDPAGTHVLAHQVIPGPAVAARVCVIPHDPEAYARAMYAEWHRCDAEGARWIVVEAVPDLVEWAGVSDRLRRAAAP